MPDTDGDRQTPETWTPDAIEIGARLRMGARGVAVDIPRDWPGLRTLGDQGLIVEDPTNKVQWAVVHSVFPLVLSGGDDNALEEDVRQSVRLAFDAEARKAAAAGRRSPMPVTANPGWSPLIEMEVRNRQDGVALVVLHRLAHDGGNEVVTGRVLIPTTLGLTEIECRAHDAMSGIRASIVMLLAPEAQRPEPGALTEPAGAAQLDDPRNDAFVPDALSRVRRGLRWLFSSDGGNLRVLSLNEPQNGGGRIVADRAGCSFVLPPRYARLRAQTPLDSAIDVFVCVTASVLLGNPWTLDVFKLSPSGFTPNIDGLRSLAEKNIREWTSEGVVVEDFASHPVRPRQGCLELRSTVRHRHGDRVCRSLQHWIWRTSWVPGRGALWRITITTDDGIPVDRFAAQLDAVAASWRPI